MNCLFCKIAQKEIPSKIIYEDEKVIAFLDIHPNCNGHTLLIPKKHVETYFDLDNETLLHMKKVTEELTNTVLSKLNKTGMTLQMNYGTSQEIKHVHLHLLPNYHNQSKIKPLEEIFNQLK
ncbi:MAG: HIT domain-containing protein [Bacilli bacterium]|jgi:histidine triad (HIT) family protein|nr:HIT domain-containing protein [Bacilli bacterium]